MVNDLEPKDRDIAMVFQNYALYPHMSVYDNMAYGLRIRGLSRQDIDTRVKRAGEILELGPLLQRRPRELSGGQRQRVAMGRAIVREPAVFLFDEPLSNLDAKLRVQMRAELQALHRRLGTTSLFVTHDQVEAMTLAQRMIVMNAGRAEQIGAPLDVYAKPATTFVAGFIGSPPMNLIPSKRNGQDVLLGVRPEHLEPCAPGDAMLTVNVDLIEPLGSGHPGLRPPRREFDRCARRGAPRSVVRRAHRAAGGALRSGARALLRSRQRETDRRVTRAVWPYPRVIAHRGGGTLAPENTLGAIRHGASLGFRGVEFDVMLTGDSTPVLIHDETLERTTDGRGEVARLPYGAIEKFDAGRWLAERWRGERVPMFGEAARLCRELGLWANVEIKPAKGFEAQTGRAVAQMALDLWRGAALAPLLSSFAPEALRSGQGRSAAAAARHAGRQDPAGLEGAHAGARLRRVALQFQGAHGAAAGGNPRGGLRGAGLDGERSARRAAAVRLGRRQHRHRPAGPDRPGYKRLHMIVRRVSTPGPRCAL